MAVETYAAIKAANALNDAAMQFYLSMLSGQNKDGTAFALPISASLTATAIAIEDGTTPAQKLLVDPSGFITVKGSGTFNTTVAAPTTANILNGYQTFTATTGATTLLTIPQTRTWVGTIGAACAAQVAAAATTAGQARAVFATAGTGVPPAAGTLFAVEAKAGANAVAGLVGSQDSTSASVNVVVAAPAGNSVTITVVSTNTGTASICDTWASGLLQ